jgi:hypothetical protein
LARSRGGDLLVPEAGVGAEQDLARGASAADAGDQLVDEALGAPLRVRRALPEPHVQRLVAAGAGRQQRVVAELTRVPVAGALLRVAVHLADERVEVEHQPPLTGAGARLPRASQRLGQDAVELAHVPEGERAQERPQRRRGQHPVPEHQPGAAGAQDVTVGDRVGAQQHRVHQRQHLPPRPRPARSARQADRLVDQLLEPEPLRQRRRQQQPGVRDRPLVIELDLQPVQHYTLSSLHHLGDLLTRGRGCPPAARNPCLGAHFQLAIRRNQRGYAVNPG